MLIRPCNIYRLGYANGAVQDVFAPNPGEAVRKRMGLAMPSTVTDLSAAHRGEEPRVAVRMYTVPNSRALVAWYE